MESQNPPNWPTKHDLQNGVKSDKHHVQCTKKGYGYTKRNLKQIILTPI